LAESTAGKENNSHFNQGTPRDIVRVVGVFKNNHRLKYCEMWQSTARKADNIKKLFIVGRGVCR
jgi:hypothetical protein